MVQNVVWHLFEQNFRFEFLALDRSIFPRNNRTAQDEDRDALVAKVFPSTVLVMLRPQRSREGLGAAKLEDRALYVERFRRVLQDWPGEDAKLLKMMPAVEYGPGRLTHTFVARKLEAVEQTAYRFYCQTFFNYYGRAATIPHQFVAC